MAEFFSSYQALSLRLVIAAIFVGMVIALFGSVYHARVSGSLVRRVLSHPEADSGENGLTLSQLGVKNTVWIRLALRRNGTLRRSVGISLPSDGIGQKDAGLFGLLRFGKQKVAPSRLRFFIEPERRDRATVIYRSRGASLVSATVASVLLIGVAVATVFFAEELITMTKNFINHYFL